MTEYNIFTDSLKIQTDTLNIINEIIYYKKHNFDNELIAKKLNLEYLDWINKLKGEPENHCGHFELGKFGSYDIEINFAILNNNEIGFEVCLCNDDKSEEIKEVLIFKHEKISEGPGLKLI